MKNDITTYKMGSDEHKRLNLFARYLREISAEKYDKRYDFHVLDIYFDVGQDWMYTAVVAFDREEQNGVRASWQALNPRQHKEILSADVTKLDEVFKNVADEVFSSETLYQKPVKMSIEDALKIVGRLAEKSEGIKCVYGNDYKALDTLLEEFDKSQKALSEAQELLYASHELLKKQEQTPYTLNLLCETVHYSITNDKEYSEIECDGTCIKEDIENWIDSYGLCKDYGDMETEIAEIDEGDYERD